MTALHVADVVRIAETTVESHGRGTFLVHNRAVPVEAYIARCRCGWIGPSRHLAGRVATEIDRYHAREDAQRHVRASAREEVGPDRRFTA